MVGVCLRAIVVFPSKAGKTRRIAEAIASGLKENGCVLDFAELELAKKQKPKAKVAELELKPMVMELSAFDLVVFGSPVFGLSPKRKISKTVEAFIKQCSSLDGRKVAVFLSCFGVAGTALKKISGMLQARNAAIVDSLVITYLLGINKRQLEQAKQFGKKIAVLQS